LAVTQIVAADSRKALAQAARRFFGDPAARLCLAGVTGTKGKTTLAHLLEAVLQAAGHRTGMIGTLGTRHTRADGSLATGVTGLTTPESVELMAMLAGMVQDGVTAVAMEVSSHALEQHRVGGLDYDVGVFTNLSLDHLDYHKTMEAYFQAKTRLLHERLKASGAAVLNLDDPRVATLLPALPSTRPVFGFSKDPSQSAARVRVRQADLTPAGVHASISCDGKAVTVHSELVGVFNLENILAAVAVGMALGLAPEAIAAGVKALRAVPGRCERVSSRPLVVVDYAHVPDALEKIIDTLREVTRGRLLCVFGCGGDRDSSKRPVMGRIVGEKTDAAIVTNDNPRTEVPERIAEAIVDGLLRTRMPEGFPGGYIVELDRAKAIETAVLAAGDDDTVLIAGKGHEDYQIIGREKRHFDDRQEAQKALARRNRGPRPDGSAA
jgi:UDP-N-acetylmuramoyl-L-alanyl-D-glutamate--2,6-diaminopimelate ligase